jgi:hypothetical protein
MSIECEQKVQFILLLSFEFTGRGVGQLRYEPEGRGFDSIGNFHSLNPLNAELNPNCHLPALLGAHHILHVSRVRVKPLIVRS